MVDQFVLGVEPEGFCGHEDISDIGSALSGVGIEGEHGVEVGDVLGGEDGVFTADILGHDSFEIFL